jgi:hypothetical protein
VGRLEFSALVFPTPASASGDSGGIETLAAATLLPCSVAWPPPAKPVRWTRTTAAGLSLPHRIHGAQADGGSSMLTAAAVRLQPVSASDVLQRWWPDAGSSPARLDLDDSTG